MSKTFTEKLIFLEHVHWQGFFLPKLKSVIMCFKLNIFHSNLKDNVYAQVYFGKLYVATRIRTHRELFMEIISSLKDSRNCHCSSHYLTKTQDYSLQTSLQSTKLYQTPVCSGILLRWNRTTFGYSSVFARKRSIIRPFC